MQRKFLILIMGTLFPGIVFAGEVTLHQVDVATPDNSTIDVKPINPFVETLTLDALKKRLALVQSKRDEIAQSLTPEGLEAMKETFRLNSLDRLDRLDVTIADIQDDINQATPLINTAVIRGGGILVDPADPVDPLIP